MKLVRLLAVMGIVCLTACAAGEVEPEEDDNSSAAATQEIGEQSEGTDVPEEELAGSDDVDELVIAAAPARKVLRYTWQGQPNGYWCGPGSTRMAISSRVSAPSQTELARYMGTTTNGTAHIGLPAKALNKWLRPPTAYRARNISWTATPAQIALLKKDILARVGSGWPMVANVVSGWRPPGYPSGTIYHYVTIIGYEQSGNRVLIADPAAQGSAGPSWRNVPRQYWVSINDLGRWIGGKGYTG